MKLVQNMGELSHIDRIIQKSMNNLELTEEEQGLLDNLFNALTGKFWNQLYNAAVIVAVVGTVVIQFIIKIYCVNPNNNLNNPNYYMFSWLYFAALHTY